MTRLRRHEPTLAARARDGHDHRDVHRVGTVGGRYSDGACVVVAGRVLGHLEFDGHRLLCSGWNGSGYAAAAPQGDASHERLEGSARRHIHFHVLGAEVLDAEDVGRVIAVARDHLAEVEPQLAIRFLRSDQSGRRLATLADGFGVAWGQRQLCCGPASLENDEGDVYVHRVGGVGGRHRDGAGVVARRRVRRHLELDGHCRCLLGSGRDGGGRAVAAQRERADPRLDGAVGDHVHMCVLSTRVFDAEDVSPVGAVTRIELAEVQSQLAARFLRSDREDDGAMVLARSRGGARRQGQVGLSGAPGAGADAEPYRVARCHEVGLGPADRRPGGHCHRTHAHDGDKENGRGIAPRLRGLPASVDETDAFPSDQDRSGQEDQEDQAERAVDELGHAPHGGHDKNDASYDPAGRDGVLVVGVVRVPFGHEAEAARSLNDFGHPVGDERTGLAGRIRGLSIGDDVADLDAGGIDALAHDHAAHRHDRFHAPREHDQGTIPTRQRPARAREDLEDHEDDGEDQHEAEDDCPCC